MSTPSTRERARPPVGHATGHPPAGNAPSERPVHRYETIAEEIRGTIARGSYGPDGRLPSERWFGKSFGAQRNTVRQALGLLEREGRIVAVGKSGWFVAGLAGSPPELAGRGEGAPAPSEPETQDGGTQEGRVLFVKFQRPLGMTADRLSSGLGEVLGGRGVPLLRFDSAEYEEARHVATIEELTTVDARGIVIWPHASMDRRMLARLQALTPLVLVDRRVYGFESDSVVFEDLLAGREITEHLLASGHRRIAFFADEPFVESVQNRLRGFRQALEGAGIAPDDRLIALVNGHVEPTFGETVRLLLRGTDEPPSAIVCANDAVASAVFLVLREMGLRVPEDVALTGFGNDSAGFLDVIGLTTMAQPFVELGREAGRLLLRRLTQPAGEASRPVEIALPMRLIVRSSSARPR